MLPTKYAIIPHSKQTTQFSQQAIFRPAMSRCRVSTRSNASSGATSPPSIVVQPLPAVPKEVVEVTPDIPQTCSPQFLASKLKTVAEMKQDMNLLMNYPNATSPDLFRSILLRTKQ